MSQSISIEDSRKQGGVLGGKVANIHPGNIVGKARSRPNDPKFQDRSTPAPNSRMVSLLDLQPGDCRYPIGDPRNEGFGFCGAEAHRGSYCPHHRSLVYMGVWSPGK